MVRFISFGAVLVCAAACNGDDRLQGRTDFDSDYVSDAEGPVIEHTPITAAQVVGEDILVDATVHDESDVFVVEIWYQRETAVEWKNTSMVKVGDLPDDGGSLYQGRIRGSDVGSGGMRYYLSAIDYSEAANEGCLPEDCSEDAWRFPVVPQ